METIPGHLERLPPGGDRFQAELLSREPRERILIATAELVAKRGYQGTPIEQIVKRAGVSRATFYEHFANREDCLLATFSEGVEELRGVIEEAVDVEADWPSRIRAALAAFIDFVVERPALARTCLVETVTAGPAAMERYERALQSFAPILREGRAHVKGGGEELPDTLEDMIVGGLVWMVHQRLVHNEIEDLPDLLPTMVEFALAPYLGEKQAAAVAAG